MSGDVDRTNRYVLSFLGLVMLAAGGYGLARGFGSLGDRYATGALLSSNVTSFVARNSQWFGIVAALAALPAAYSAWWWLRAQIPTPDSPGQLTLTSDDSGGYTRVHARAAANGLARDIARHHNVRAAKVRLTSDARSPQVEMNVDVYENADFESVRAYIEDDALERFQRMIDAVDLRARIELNLSEAPGRSLA